MQIGFLTKLSDWFSVHPALRLLFIIVLFFLCAVLVLWWLWIPLDEAIRLTTAALTGALCAFGLYKGIAWVIKRKR